ncbi:glycosyltransferase [Alkalimonas delamerensis]|uniref:Glycosyltransferase n=1 Tax=Alkalimonas delamerensis TaxID=265981 RepID=A0ABT9GPS6_9GAMM|nr:glycosyltransferase [Alkalimonas delamerensis]MDP4528982.1 glycosyltransferase [Alkalimonas delamerensis]
MKQPQQAISACFEALHQFKELAPCWEFNLELYRNAYRKQRRSEGLKIAVSGSNISLNAAGRALTLFDLYRYSGYDTELIGVTTKKDAKAIWPPLRQSGVALRSLAIDSPASFLEKALQFVLANPYDMVHLSKPRMSNVVLGCLYKLVWGSYVIMDVDDEELSFVGAEHPIIADEFHSMPAKTLNQQGLLAEHWTRIAVGLIHLFDETTVSNPALKGRYPGIVIPHVRDETIFSPSLELRAQSRKRFDIPENATVVLFFGTPRVHKGLIETAEAIASLKREDVIYAIVGDFTDLAFKQNLKSIAGVNYRFIADQPYQDAAKVVAMGDICVLLQDTDALVAQYQLPAKLIDALAMGLQVFVQQTPALAHIVESGVVTQVTKDSLTERLSEYLASNSKGGIHWPANAYFKNQLSMAAAKKEIERLVHRATNSKGWGWRYHSKLQALLTPCQLAQFIKACEIESSKFSCNF